MFGGTRDPRSEARGAVRALKALLAGATLALALVLLGGAPAQAQDPVEVLVFHGPVDDPTTDPGVAAIEALGASRGFTVEATGDPTAISADGLDGVSAVVFLNTAGDLLDAEQEGALEAFIGDGGGFLGIGSAAQSEPGTEFFDGLIGARPSADSATEESEQTVVFGDRVHPATDGLPLQAARTDAWYRWIERPTGKVHTIARYHAPDAPAGDGTDVGGTDQPISWCRDFGGGRSFYTGMGRTRGELRRGRRADPSRRRDPVGRRPAARQLQGDDQQQLRGQEDRRRGRREHRPRQHGRVARSHRGPERLGALHRPRRLPHRRGARRAARRQPVRAHPRPRGRPTSASAAAASTSGIPARPTATSTAASRAPGRSRSTATAARAGSAPTRTTTRWSTACSASPPRRTSRRAGTSTCSTSRPSTRRARRPASRWSGASRSCRSRASRASR